MLRFLVYSFFFFNFVFFSLNSDDKEVCNDNYCYVYMRIHDAIEIKKQTCPYSYKPLEFQTNQIWKSFVKLISSKDFRNQYIYLNIGIYSKDWYWVDGTKFEYEKVDILKNVGDDSNFACLNKSSFTTQNYQTLSTGWICQTEDCYEDNDNCYELVTGENRMTWFQSMNFCLEKGKKLASFKNNQIPETILKNMKQSNNQDDSCSWIGLIKNSYKWKSTNEMVLFNKWSKDSSFFSENICSFVYPLKLKWFSTPCFQKNFTFFCMKEISQETNNSINCEKYATKSNDLSLGLGLGIPLFVVFVALIVSLITIFKLRKKSSSISNPTEVIYSNKEVEDVQGHSSAYQGLSHQVDTPPSHYQGLSPYETISE